MCVLPMQCVPEASDDSSAVWAGDGFAQRTAEVMQDVIAAFHGHFHPRAALSKEQRPWSRGHVLDAHVVLP